MTPISKFFQGITELLLKVQSYDSRRVTPSLPRNIFLQSCLCCEAGSSSMQYRTTTLEGDNPAPQYHYHPARRAR
ncbi:hypothetical protein EMGR_006552 [Emarellia grisea]